MRNAACPIRRTLLKAMACAIGLAMAASVTGCSGASQFNGQRALRDVQTQCAMGARIPGSVASSKAQDYFLRELAHAGWTVERQEFEYRGVPLTNIIAKRGQGPLVLIGAHYDSRGRADRDPFDRNANVPGADDGASGAAVLLELARVLTADSLNNEVWLTFFDAEDQGELNGGWAWSVGANHVAGNLPRRPEYVVVVDMVGDADQQLYWEWNSTRSLAERIWGLAAGMGYSDFFVPTYRYSMTDDHTPFLERNIPAIDIIDFDYAYWHSSEDTPDKLSAASLERVGRVLQRLLEAPAAP